MTSKIDISSLATISVSAFNFLLNLATIPTSLINLLLIGRTHLLHRNLKWILICQSACIFIRSVCRLIVGTTKVIWLDPLGPESMFPILSIQLYCAFFRRNFVAHVLIIERLMATLGAGTYEHRTGWLFTLCWCPIVFSISLLNILMMNNGLRTLINMLITTITSLIGGAEYAIFAWLSWHSKNIYKQKLAELNGGHNLSERYQLSENIRVGQQLIPVLLFQFINNLVTMLNVQYQFFDLWQPRHVQFFTIFVGTVCGLAIEIVMINCHPFLRRDFFALLNTKFRRHRITDHQNTTDQQNTVSQLALRDIITGRALISEANTNDQNIEANEHFAMLKKMWEK